MVNSPEGFRAIYETQANVRKARSYGAWPRQSGVVNTFSCIDKAKHAVKRRVFNSAISDKAIRSAEGFVRQHADRWCELLLDGDGKSWSEPRNMTNRSDYLVFDILGELCYGKSFETKEPGENALRSVPHNIVQYMRFLYSITMSPFVNIWISLKPKGLDKLFAISMPQDMKKYVNFVQTSMSQRFKEEETYLKNGADASRKDMLYYIFRAKDPETEQPGYTRAEIIEEAEMLTVAAADTVSGVLAAMFFYLLRNPPAHEKLRCEIRETFTNLQYIKSGLQLASCRYLRAVIDETLRMSPPGSSDMVREVLPGGLHLHSDFIPQGTQVGTGIYSLHHSQDLYPDPFNFRPERWIVSDAVSADSVALAESGFFPFLTGSRGCPGKNLALMQLSVIMARLLFRLDIRAVEGDTLGEGHPELGWGRRNKGQFQTKDAFVPVRNGPLVQFRLRNTYCD